jgi:hypothetical protein
MRTSLLFFALLTLGCSKGQEPDHSGAHQAILDRHQRTDSVGEKQPTGDKVEIKGPAADGSVNSATASAVKVPEDFPKDVPVYPAATPIIHTSTKGGRTLELKTSDAVAKVRAFYKEKLKAEGWKQDSDSSTVENTLLMNTKDNRTLAVVICYRDHATGLILSVSTPERPKKTGDPS